MRFRLSKVAAIYFSTSFSLLLLLHTSKAASLGNHCALKNVKQSVKAAAHPQSVKRDVTFEISTAEVDPDYLLSFKTRTISVPEFEEFIQRQANAANTKVVRTLCKFDSRSSCSVSHC